MRTRISHSDWKPRWLIRCVSAALLSFMDKQVGFCVSSFCGAGTSWSPSFRAQHRVPLQHASAQTASSPHTRSQFKPEPSQTQAPVTPATEPERRAGGSLTTSSLMAAIRLKKPASTVTHQTI